MWALFPGRLSMLYCEPLRNSKMEEFKDKLTVRRKTKRTNGLKKF